MTLSDLQKEIIKEFEEMFWLKVQDKDADGRAQKTLDEIVALLKKPTESFLLSSTTKAWEAAVEWCVEELKRKLRYRKHIHFKDDVAKFVSSLRTPDGKE